MLTEETRKAMLPTALKDSVNPMVSSIYFVGGLTRRQTAKSRNGFTYTSDIEVGLIHLKSL
ncbi:MAG: hypothetical protein APG10_01186 [Candidatus Methanofastidiosum methylothiophilum]|uniref:Uncharacterized protein n=1 Tax=Candidatus Methanofastidiosum methylothiophilum TaxID=1705564 RepID=A0A150IH83_9EURY|nr:MAG: hypothetical protein APG10_01798 [Candidatus Methanofastidiosum methylthiophilus]KYC44978.1 MAG: hypothetical protein APG10_01238 [Candidatus Methanofastidiosum methylthiophilus]KYC45043.1 MAG: hypothetical protein APG10_01186 [Candidatus Methanofastidiosum methylthiophilus]